MDCIHLQDASAGTTGWAAWSPAQADAALTRYQARKRRQQRLAQKKPAGPAAPTDAKSSVIAAALARARAARQT